MLKSCISLLFSEGLDVSCAQLLTMFLQFGDNSTFTAPASEACSPLSGAVKGRLHRPSIWRSGGRILILALRRAIRSKLGTTVLWWEKAKLEHQHKTSGAELEASCGVCNPYHCVQAAVDVFLCCGPTGDANAHGGFAFPFGSAAPASSVFLNRSNNFFVQITVSQ